MSLEYVAGFDAGESHTRVRSPRRRYETRHAVACGTYRRAWQLGGRRPERPCADDHQRQTADSTAKAEFVRIYGTPPLGGNFWYDPRSGLWGVMGREAFGLLRPGHGWGALAPTASAGSTGVFINGRQINLAEALYIRNLFGSVVPGRWWLDGTTGYFGVEGSQIPAGNLFATARAAQARAGGSSYYNDGMGTSVAVSAGCATGTAGSGSSQVSFIAGCD
jgi:hypothetical protein